MNESFSADVAAALAGDDTEQRAKRTQAAEAALEAGMPSSETEEWRYSPIGEFPVASVVPAARPELSVGRDPLADVVHQRAATVVVCDGYVQSIVVDPGWEAKGLSVTANPVRFDLASDADSTPASKVSQRADSGDDTVFDHLHHAFCPETIEVIAPRETAITDPVVVLSHHATPRTAAFSHLVIRTGEAAELSVVEHQSSTSELGLGVPVVDLQAEQASRLNYVVIQENGERHWQVSRQFSQVGAQATITSGIAAFGGHYARTRTDSRLVGRGGTANLIASYYGDRDQVHDFRTFQHHEARDTRSDLLFKGSQDDKSGSVYTGLIHIHPSGAGSNAFQTNRNVKLNEDAWAWSVPNLEIENSDVHCSHASTVSPIDEDQRFYLHTRGVPPLAADRLVVAGFYGEVLDRMPIAGVGDEIRRLIASKLDRRLTDG